MSSSKNTPPRTDDEVLERFFESDQFYIFFDLPRPRSKFDHTEPNAVEEDTTHALSEGEPIELISIEENNIEQTSNNASSEGDRTNEWSFEENQQFENALAEFDPSSPTFYVDVASRVQTKSIIEIINHYLDLVEDIDMIEAGLIEPPEYKDDQSDSKKKGKGKAHASSSKQQKETAGAKKRKSFAWTEEEHRMFLVGLDKFGAGDWRSISRYCVKTKSPTQIASHAQKYFRRLNKEASDDCRRRQSIHDIRSVTTTTTTATSVSIPLPDQNTEQTILPTTNNFSFNSITNASNSDQQQSHDFIGHFHSSTSSLPLARSTTPSVSIQPPHHTNTEQTFRPAATKFFFDSINVGKSQQEIHDLLDYFHSSTSSLPLTRSTTFTGHSIPPPITTTTTSISFPPIREKTEQRLSHGFPNHGSTTFTPATTTTKTTAPSILFPPRLKDKSPEITQQPFPGRNFMSYNNMKFDNAYNNNRGQSSGMGTFANSSGGSSSLFANSHGSSSSSLLNNYHQGSLSSFANDNDSSSSLFANNSHRGSLSSHGSSSSLFGNNYHRGLSTSFANNHSGSNGNYHGGGSSSSRPLSITPTTSSRPLSTTPTTLPTTVYSTSANPSSTTHPSSSSSVHSPWSWFFK